MSSTSSTRSTTPTPSTYNLLFDSALAEYNKHTGQDLLDHPQVAAIDQCDSLDLMLNLFREQSRAFDKFSNDDPKLIKWLKPIVLILRAIGRSEALGAGATVVSPTRFHILSSTSFNATSRHSPLKNMSYMELASSSPCVSLSPFPASS